MTKRKRRSRRRQVNRSPVSRQNGYQFFKNKNYDQAIHIWEQMGEKSHGAQPRDALAEAYFRRGLENLRSKTPDLQRSFADILKATELCPDDALYLYYLGLAKHRLGHIDEALTIYQKACQRDKTFVARAAYPMALALLQSGKDPAADPIWENLPEREQTLLKQASAFRRRPYQVSDDAPVLWQGLAALDRNDQEMARALFNQVIETSENGDEIGVAHYYLGILAAQTEDFFEARKQWTKAALKGYHSPALTNNLAELYHRLAEERLSAGDLTGALDAAQESLRHKPDDKRLKDLLAHVYHRQGYQAASEDNWEEALAHWQAAHTLEGGSFRSAYNLALAHEKNEDFFSAGAMWREALRRRPRRADHPDAISDEEVAKLWRRTAEAYIKAEEYAEAINVYKLAVKWNPDHLETRMALVDGLMNDGRLQAAQNELERILEKDQDYIPALLQMGEILMHTGYWWYASGALQYFQRVLELEPDNVLARQGAVDFYLDQADNYMRWQGPQSALQYYEKALEIHPQNALTLALLGGCYLAMEQPDKALSYLTSAREYGRGNMQVYSQLLQIWLDQGDNAKAWEIMTEAEASIPDLPFQFYLLPAIYCLEIGDYDLARPWLDHVVAQAPPEENILLVIGEMLSMTGALDMAEEYLNKAIEAEQNPGSAYATLCVIALRQRNREKAQAHLDKAERIARRSRDPELKQQVQSARELFSIPPEMINFVLNNPFMFSDGPFGGLDPAGFLDDEYYLDDEYNDEEFDNEFFNLF
jgi:tetratricopeptide (TPR) repeat protein